MESVNIQEEAKRLVERLPSSMTWDDLMRAICVRQAIEAGLADSSQGRLLDVMEVRRRFGVAY
jgi:hypothetical protein